MPTEPAGDPLTHDGSPNPFLGAGATGARTSRIEPAPVGRGESRDATEASAADHGGGVERRRVVLLEPRSPAPGHDAGDGSAKGPRRSWPVKRYLGAPDVDRRVLAALAAVAVTVGVALGALALTKLASAPAPAAPPPSSRALGHEQHELWQAVAALARDHELARRSVRRLQVAQARTATALRRLAAARSRHGSVGQRRPPARR
jgi:hypothetical protein